MKYALIFNFFIFLFNIMSIITLDMIPSGITKMITINNKLIYITESESDITVFDLNDESSQNIDSDGIKINKSLIKLNDEEFIFFGYEESNSVNLRFNIYNMSEHSINSIIKKGTFNNINHYQSCDIKMINRNNYISYSYKGQEALIYSLDVESKASEGYTISISNDGLSSNIVLAAMECDSYDSNIIICIYSLKLDENQMNLYYSYIDLSSKQTSFQFNNNAIDANAVTGSLLKVTINNKNKFYIFYSKGQERDNDLYCKIFIQQDHRIYIEETKTIGHYKNYYIGKTNYFYSNSMPMKSILYNYSIFIILEMTTTGDNIVSLLYICSLDLNLCMENLTDIGARNVLINENFIIIYQLLLNEQKTNLQIIKLKNKCTNFNIQFNETNKNNPQAITNQLTNGQLIQNELYIGFLLDKSTYLSDNNNNQIIGGLTSNLKLTNSLNFNLYCPPDYEITENYYLYYGLTTGQNYIISSHICHFKVINCYESCSECNYNTSGNILAHQCSICKNGYGKLKNNFNDEGFYNCYEKDSASIPENMYLIDGEYQECDISCKKCKDAKDRCIECSGGYYFKYDIKDNICYGEKPKNYYLDVKESKYKPCYETCEECYGEGNEINNNCISCKGNLTNYNFDKTKCTKNYLECEKYWYLDNNKDIQCCEKCDGFLIEDGINKNQYVTDCTNYINPFNNPTESPGSLLNFICKGEKRCITFEECINKRGLKTDLWGKNCLTEGDSCYHIPETTIVEIPPTSPPTQPPKIIQNRVRCIKNFQINENYSQIKDDFKKIQFLNYISELETELSLGIYINGIEFITFSQYYDFNITIYPLDTEEYVLSNLLEVNNLIYGDFTKLFENYKKQISNKNYKILIALVERQNRAFLVNTLDYFFILFDEEKKELVNFISIEDLEETHIDITYPLHYFKHENITKKYSEQLISTIKELNKIDENFNFFDKNNEFYNDICYTYTSDKNMDVTIEDRINEYYIDISLCEDGCSFKNIIDKDRNPKSLCQCELNDEVNIDKDNYSFKVTEKEKKSVSNFKALTCYKEVFSSKKITSNPAFWIFLIIITIVVFLFISIIFCGKGIIENMLKIKKENAISNRTNNNDNIIINNDNNIINNENNNNNQLENNNDNINNISPYNQNANNDDINTKKKDKINNSNSVKDSMSNAEEDSKIYKISKKESSESNPPRKKIVSKNRETTGKANSKNENDTSLFESEYNYNNDKDSGFEDIFDDIGNAATSKMNNYVQNEKNIKKDNYIYLEKRKLFGKIMQSIPPLDKKEFNKYKYINTVNEYNDKQQARNINLTGFDIIKKEHYSSDDINKKMKNFNLINYSFIKNKGTQKLSKFSKLYGEESLFSGNERFLQAGNIIDNNENKINIENNKDEYDEEDKYENNLRENNNNINNDSESNISEKNKNSEKDSQMNDIFKKKKKKSLVDSSSVISENRKLKNSFNSSINSNNKLLLKNSKKLNDEENTKKLKNSNEDVLYNKKNVLSSSESEIDSSVLDDKERTNVCYFYCDYFVQREIILASFYNKHDNISFFIRISTFFVVLGFMFMLNCLFLTTAEIHERYEYANNNETMNEFKYVFKYRIGICLILSIIIIVFKMICVKLVYFLAFKIKSETKEEISPFAHRNLNQSQTKELNKKKNKYLKKYKTRSIIFMIIVLILLLAFAYISICYVGTFPKAFYGVLLRLVISFIFSILFCAFLCFLVNIFYCGKCFKVFNILKIIY